MGGGACVIPLYIANKYPHSQSEVVEISQKVIGAAKQFYFPLFGRADYPNLIIIKSDAIDYLRKSNKLYDFIFQDISVGKEVPKKFMSRNWLTSLVMHLNKKGSLVINIGSIKSRDSPAFIFEVPTYLEKKYKMSLFLFKKNVILLISLNAGNIDKAKKSFHLKRYLATLEADIH